MAGRDEQAVGVVLQTVELFALKELFDDLVDVHVIVYAAHPVIDLAGFRITMQQAAIQVLDQS